MYGRPVRALLPDGEPVSVEIRIGCKDCATSFSVTGVTRENAVECKAVLDREFALHRGEQPGHRPTKIEVRA